jgi:hypothetical protein
MAIVIIKERRLLWETNSTDIESKSIEELCRMIVEKIEKEWISIPEPIDLHVRLEDCFGKLLTTALPFAYHPCLKNALFNIMQGASANLFHEIEKHDTEFLQERIKIKLEEIDKENLIDGLIRK